MHSFVNMDGFLGPESARSGLKNQYADRLGQISDPLVSHLATGATGPTWLSCSENQVH